MIGGIKKAIFFFIYITGLARLIRYIKQKETVTIFLLHNIEYNKADLLFKKLAQNYTFISLKDYIEGRESLNKRYQKKKYKAILSFDDGYKENFELLGLFKKYNIPTTIFICSSIVGTNKHFWSTYNSGDIEMSEIKSKSHAEMVKYFNSLGYYRDKEYGCRQALSIKEIATMLESGFVDFQSHTKYHPILTKLDDLKAYEEIYESKKEIQSLLKINETKYFAYPNGSYGKRELNYVKKAGYRCSLTVDFGYNTEQTDLHKLKRICLNDNGTIYENLVKSTGLWNILKEIKRSIKLT